MWKRLCTDVERCLHSVKWVRRYVGTLGKSYLLAFFSIAFFLPCMQCYFDLRRFLIHKTLNHTENFKQDKKCLFVSTHCHFLQIHWKKLSTKKAQISVVFSHSKKFFMPWAFFRSDTELSHFPFFPMTKNKKSDFDPRLSSFSFTRNDFSAVIASATVSKTKFIRRKTL